jgi:hypothetical protein
MRPFSPFLLFGLAAVALFCLAGATLLAEGSPFVERIQTLDRRIEAIGGAAADGASVSILESRFARKARLDTCLSTLSDAVGSVKIPLATQADISRGCLAIAKAVAARSPLDGNAWFIAASLAARSGNMADAETYLNLSFRTGPSEQWIAERRALFGYAVHDNFSETTRKRIDEDLALLLRTERGVDVLALTYVLDAAMRDHLVVIAETLDEDIQERFLDRIRREIRRTETGRNGGAAD